MNERARAWARAVKEKARELGFDRVGIAPAGPSPHGDAFLQWLQRGYAGEMRYMAREPQRRLDPRHLLPEVRSIIVVARDYWVPASVEGLLSDPSRGRISRYAWGKDYHDVLKPRLFALDAFLRHLSGREHYAKAYVDTGPVLERAWAERAGLGFIGKNTCLIHPRLGSWMFLGVLLVPEILDPDPAPELLSSSPLRWRLPDGQVGTCGTCRRCLDACPTGAFEEEYVLDARRCISYLTIELRGPIPRHLRPQMGNWIFGCDVCQDVCPWNRRFARPSDEPAFTPDPDRIAPPLLELIALDEEGFRQRFRKTPIMRAKRRGLLRNVCVALGNWGDPVAVPALSAVLLQDAEPLIRGHAAWALGRIGTGAARAALNRAWGQETDAYVREEIAWSLDAMG